MGCKTFGVSQVLIGLHRVGLVGLKDALELVRVSALKERQEVVDHLVASLASDNYIPAGQDEAYRTTLWREYLRYRGKDISHLYTEVEVKVRGEPGEDRDQLTEMADSVFGEFELKPMYTFLPAGEEGPYPQLVVGDDSTIIRGLVGRQAFKSAVRKSFTDW